MTLTPGQEFAGYVVVSRLGTGGSGETYLVEHPQLRRREVVRRIASSAIASPSLDGMTSVSDTRRDRFTAEARIAASLSHRSIVRIYNYGVADDDSLWVAMPHLEGKDLSAARPAPVEVPRIAGQIADALDYAHGQGVIHGDVGPSSIFLTDDGHTGGTGRAILLGLGMRSSTSAAGIVAPEVRAGARADARSDQYGLAATIHSLLAGTPLAAAAPPGALDRIFGRALAADPRERFPDCRSFAAELARALPAPRPVAPAPPPPVVHPLALSPTGAVAAPPTPPPVPQYAATALSGAPASSPAPRRRTGRRAVFAGGAIVAIGLIVAALVFWPRGDDAAPAPAAGPPLTGVTAISAGVGTGTGGAATVCAVADAKVYCWGDNTAGQLGAGASGNSSRPVLVDGIQNASDVVTNHGGVCAITNGDLYCWGDHPAVSSRQPTLVSGLSSVTDVSIGDAMLCAVANGSAYCWGKDTTGAFGNGQTESNTSTPSRVTALSSVTDISTDSGTTCAIALGRPYCWGEHMEGQVGDGTPDPDNASDEQRRVRSTPVRVLNLSNATSIETRKGTTCAIFLGDVFCWGQNNNGQLGDSTTGNRNTPTPVSSVSGATGIATSGTTTCAVASSSVQCWGNNWTGQLGDGGTTPSKTPVTSGQLAAISIVTAGGDTTCAVGDSGAWCWGDNRAGSVGDGTTDNQADSPRAVVSPESTT